MVHKSWLYSGQSCSSTRKARNSGFGFMNFMSLWPTLAFIFAVIWPSVGQPMLLVCLPIRELSSFVWQQRLSCSYRQCSGHLLLLLSGAAVPHIYPKGRDVAPPEAVPSASVKVAPLELLGPPFFIPCRVGNLSWRI